MSTAAKTTELKSTTELDTLKADIAALREDLAKLVGDTKAFTKGTAEAAMTQGKDKLRETANDLAGQKAIVETKVKENPLLSLGIAFGLGALLAAVTRRR